MLKKLPVVCFPLLLAVGGCAQSVNVSGTWTAKTTSQLGQARQRITFKQDGDRFMGEMITSEGRKEIIRDGKINGDEIEFRVVRKRATGETVLVLYRGKLTGNQMAGSFVGWSGRTVNWSATQ